MGGQDQEKGGAVLGMDPTRWKVNWHNLAGDLERLGSIAAVAAEYKCVPSTIGRMAIKLGLLDKMPFADRGWLYQKYVVEQMSLQAIGDMCAVDRRTIGLYLNKFGIESRSLAKIKRIPVVCVNCGKTVMAKPHTVSAKRYCSRACRIIFRTKTGLQVNPFTRMGNGREPTKAEETMAALLPWYEREWVVHHDPPKAGGAYRIDFAIPEIRLAVEIDGSSHSLPNVVAKDRKRDGYLRSKGWTVIRVTNDEVMASPEAAAKRIKAEEVRLFAASIDEVIAILGRSA